ncbi:glycosyltransferase family 2 protein [Mucilaginibacter sp.]|uniref:glycosyltransferase family 2 protein n=1 Tax=Mucilaginibacter sp. TaxID=1882438 RepID=UPI0035BC60CE
MKVAGFTFIRNAVKNDYPVVQSITSILPLCDEFVVVVGNSDDGTRQLIAAIESPKIRIIDSVWDESIKDGGRVFAVETDKAFVAISPDADWAFYIQGDELVHERYHTTIKKEMEETLIDPSIEGLLFKYMHFYGSYDYFGQSRRWYRREIRLLKNIKGVHAYRDAQGFRLNDRKMRVKLIDAYIYHYGWAKPLKGLNNKIRNFNRYYHDEQWVQQHIPDTYEFDYGNADKLVKFTGTHPAVMQKRIAATNWNIDFGDKSLQKNMDLRRKVLQKIEDWTGWRIGEYKNYIIVKRYK